MNDIFIKCITDNINLQNFQYLKRSNDGSTFTCPTQMFYQFLIDTASVTQL